MSGVGGAAKAHKSSLHAIASILRQEGVFGVYNGLSAGLLRQATYTTTRLGVFTSLMEKFKRLVIEITIFRAWSELSEILP